MNKNPVIAFDATSRLFSDFAQPSKFYSISFSYDDLGWAQSKFEELFSDPELLKEIQAPNRGGPYQAKNICRIQSILKLPSLNIKDNSEDAQAFIMNDEQHSYTLIIY